MMDVSSLRQRYGAELPEAEAIHSFYNRMRRQRGIPEEAFKGGWQEGDYRKFLQDLSGAQPVPRSATWRALAGWLAVVAFCVLAIRVAVAYILTHSLRVVMQFSYF